VVATGTTPLVRGDPLDRASPQNTPFATKTPENLVFDNRGQNDAANFQRSLKGMANFMHTTYSAEVVEAILKMQAVTIPNQDKPKARTNPASQKP
jgi:hypothetical protein